MNKRIEKIEILDKAYKLLSQAEELIPNTLEPDSHNRRSTTCE